MEELKKNNEVKGIQKYIEEHIIPVLINKDDQSLDNVVGILDTKLSYEAINHVNLGPPALFLTVHMYVDTGQPRFCWITWFSSDWLSTTI